MGGGTHSQLSDPLPSPKTAPFPSSLQLYQSHPKRVQHFAQQHLLISPPRSTAAGHPSPHSPPKQLHGAWRARSPGDGEGTVQQGRTVTCGG